MRNLEQALQSKGISNETVISLLGIHRNTYSNKMSGASKFTIDEAFAIKKNLLPEYELEYLFEAS